MPVEEALQEKILNWVNVSGEEEFINFYWAWGIFRDRLHEHFLKGSPILLPAGTVTEVTRYGGEGKDDDIYWTVIFKVNDDYFKVNGFYDEWQGESGDMGEVRRLTAEEISALTS